MLANYLKEQPDTLGHVLQKELSWDVVFSRTEESHLEFDYVTYNTWESLISGMAAKRDDDWGVFSIEEKARYNFK